MEDVLSLYARPSGNGEPVVALELTSWEGRACPSNRPPLCRERGQRPRYVLPSARMNFGYGAMVEIVAPQHSPVIGAQVRTATHVDPSARVAWTLQLPAIGGACVAVMSTKISPPASAGVWVTEQGGSAVTATTGAVREV